MEDKKVYEIFLTDIWNNNILIGFFQNLDDAIEIINKNLSDEKYYLEKGDLREYPSTFNECFDVCIGDIYYNKHPEDNGEYYNEDENMWVRGFILSGELLMEELHKIMGKQ